MDTLYLIYVNTIHIYRIRILTIDRIGIVMDRNYKSIHNFIISTDVNCSKFVEQKNKRLNIYINKVILYNINK
jgi:hypothetical protein